MTGVAIEAGIVSPSFFFSQSLREAAARPLSSF